MAVSLSKGGKVSLAKAAEGAGVASLTKIICGLGWDVNRYDGGSAFDLDASAFFKTTTPSPVSANISVPQKTEVSKWLITILLFSISTGTAEERIALVRARILVSSGMRPMNPTCSSHFSPENIFTVLPKDAITGDSMCET